MPLADICDAANCSLFDHLVGDREHPVRDGEAERLGRRQIDDEIESGRLLDWDVARLHPTQNLVDIVGRAPEQVREVRSLMLRTTSSSARSISSARAGRYATGIVKLSDPSLSRAQGQLTSLGFLP